jgi:hypothetical protein
MSTGAALRDALKNNNKLWAASCCPRVSVDIGQAVYGRVMDDRSPTTLNAASSRMQMAAAIGFGGSQSETAVWHLQTAPAIHHFVLVAWYDTAAGEQCYTMFMAFEAPNPPVHGRIGYNFHEYVQNSMVPQLSKGYRDKRTVTEVMAMLSELLASDAAWGEYFQPGARDTVNSITCYKYDVISLDKAIRNVNNY